MTDPPYRSGFVDGLVAHLEGAHLGDGPVERTPSRRKRRREAVINRPIKRRAPLPLDPIDLILEDLPADRRDSP